MNYDLLKTILTHESVSGNEVPLQKEVARYMKDAGVEVTHDCAGNLYSSINREAPFQLLLAGHIDEIGFRVTDFTSEGYLKVTKAGGIHPWLCAGKRVTVMGKERLTGVFGLPKRSDKEPAMSEMYIDCGFKDKDEAKKYVTPGDFVTYTYTYDLLENRRIAGRALDDGIGAFTVLTALLEAKKLGAEVGVTAVTTVGEETGMRGAYHAAASRQPSLALACDVTFASDYPAWNSADSGEISLGGGPVLMRSSAMNPVAYRLLKKTAEAHEIPLQIEVAGRRTGTDADVMHLTGSGVPVELISLPLRYMHSPSEVASLDDIENSIKLLAAFAAELKNDQSMDPFLLDWEA